MQKVNNRELIRNIIEKKLEEYKKKLIDEMDLLSEEDKEEMADEIDRIIEQIKEDNFYKRKAEALQRRIDYLYSLEDCDEEFELWGVSKWI